MYSYTFKSRPLGISLQTSAKKNIGVLAKAHGEKRKDNLIGCSVTIKAARKDIIRETRMKKGDVVLNVDGLDIFGSQIVAEQVSAKLKANQLPFTAQFGRSTSHSAFRCKSFWEARRAFRFSPALQATAMAFLASHTQIATNILALHWRHGDIALDDPKNHLHSPGRYLLICFV